MTPGLRDRGVGVVLLDIEGTTTPISFVHEVLFPYARAHAREYLAAHLDSPEIAEVTRRLSVEHAIDEGAGQGPPAWRGATEEDALDSAVAYVEWLMDRDRKSPGLKLLQGLIWEGGYQAGLLRGRVFPDVPPALRRWHAAGLVIAIYSSGSVLAQRRLFESAEHGDLTTFIHGFFDTAVGPKVSAESYRRIAVALGRAPREMVFVSDLTTELTAAREAGLEVLLSERPGNAPQTGAGSWPSIHTFDQIVP